MASPADLTRIRAGVERALEEFLGQRRADLAAMSKDLAPCADAIADLLAGGKRLRPAFCYWGWRGCGGADDPAIFAAAAALELLHASALVHDDVMDASDTRRGQPSVHKRFEARHAGAGWRGPAAAFGAGAAILVGDLLLAWTDEMLRASGLPEPAVWHGLTVLDAMRTEVFAGQFLDLVGQASAAASVADALQVVTFKSAKYTVERPLHLGAALAVAARRGTTGAASPVNTASPANTADEAAVQAAFTGYGIPLGIAFQLRDDILGVFGDPERTGKPVTDDLREGKRTVMLAIARERADDEQAGILDSHVGDPLLNEDGAQQVRTVITGTGALAECETMIDASVTNALAVLESAPITSEAKAALAELAVAATSRTE